MTKNRCDFFLSSRLHSIFLDNNMVNQKVKTMNNDKHNYHEEDYYEEDNYGYTQDELDDMYRGAFEGEPEAYWNID